MRKEFTKELASRLDEYEEWIGVHPAKANINKLLCDMTELVSFLRDEVKYEEQKGEEGAAQSAGASYDSGDAGR